ncbi:hypothetical protein [Streptomyces sp. Ag109_G2-15]|uniref:hypothetical protein n=1 Tax=Streptomyces sp. Ag109_G2-15 TaxID=1938850 RepID=UPI000BC9166F|nr:hypothetical protein [Streptomyces sp. Ag109_G2-15]SOE08150.1 hypothetical protein SAMN06272765_9078 [Streptomyces sp. Ag109_G2-15]
MAVDQLPGRVREFANYLDGLLGRLDQGGGWCGVFWQRDPEGMQACLDGCEVPPWDVVEALLQDLGAVYGPAAAAAERERARTLHGAAISAYDARPGARDALGDRLDVMLREQRYAAERQAELSRLLTEAPSREEADALRLDLAWAQDDHERATARCAELQDRMEELDRRAVGVPILDGSEVRGGDDGGVPGGGGAPAIPEGHGAGAGALGVENGGGPRTPHAEGFGAAVGTGGDGVPGVPGVEGFGGGRARTSRAEGFGGAAVAGGGGSAVSRGGGAPSAAWRDAGAEPFQPLDAQAAGHDGRLAGAVGGRDPWFAEQAPRSGMSDPGPAVRRAGAGVDPGPWPAATDDGPAWSATDPAAARPAAPATDGRPAWSATDPATPQPALPATDSRSAWSAADPAAARPAAPATDSRPAWSVGDPAAPRPATHPTASSTHEVTPGPAPEAATPAKSRKRRRGSARFAGMVEDAGAPVVVPQAPVAAVPEVSTGRRTPRGARFAGAAEAVEAVEVPVEAVVDAEAGAAVAGAVERLVRLRTEGRTGEAHVLLVEIAQWPAARFPLLADRLQRAGLGADWATLLWEAASLPAERLVAAADALEAAGRVADGQQMLRQGVARPAEEIGAAVLGLDGEGRAREVRALLDAYVRVRTPEEAARSVTADPRRLVPLLLEAAQGVSQERHWDLVHALRVAGFTA